MTSSLDPVKDRLFFSFICLTLLQVGSWNFLVLVLRIYVDDCGCEVDAVVVDVVAGVVVVTVVDTFVVVAALLPGCRMSSLFAVFSVVTETVVPSDVKTISPCRSVR